MCYVEYLPHSPGVEIEKEILEVHFDRHFLLARSTFTSRELSCKQKQTLTITFRHNFRSSDSLRHQRFRFDLYRSSRKCLCEKYELK